MSGGRLSGRLAGVVLWTVTVWEALTMGAAGLGKFVNPDFWVIMFTAWGYPAWMSVAVGSLELGSALLLLIPATAPFAAAVLIANMAVALITVLINEVTLGWFAPSMHLALLSVILVLRLARRRA
jgi:uncharacterized membrane protein YphA (DoxX/SURF4 family)